MKVVLLFSFILIFILQISHILNVDSFRFHIDKKEKECFHENYADQTLVTFSIFSDVPESINVVVRNPDYEKIIEKLGVGNFKDSFTTFSGGYYDICIINVSNKQINIDFEAKHGIAAKDFSQVPKAGDIQPIEKDLITLEEYTKEIYHLILYSDSHEKTFGTLQDGMISGISWVSIFLVILMLVVGGIEAFIGRKIVVSRKYK